MLALGAKGVPDLTLYEKTAIMDPCEKTPDTSAAPAASNSGGVLYSAG